MGGMICGGRCSGSLKCGTNIIQGEQLTAGGGAVKDIIIIDSFILVELNILLFINNRQEWEAWPGPGYRTVAQAQCL